MIASNSLMTAEDLLSLVELIENNGVGLWLDGGWGVDALLGEQTRPHRDVDIVIEYRDVHGLRCLLAARGYSEVPRDDSSAWNFVLADDNGHEVDVHVISFDAARNGVYGPPELGLMYPATSLVGEGEVKGLCVKCISAEWQVVFHAGYQLDDNDHHDVVALCDRFDLPLPDKYRRGPENG